MNSEKSCLPTSLHESTKNKHEHVGETLYSFRHTTFARHLILFIWSILHTYSPAIISTFPSAVTTTLLGWSEGTRSDERQLSLTLHWWQTPQACSSLKGAASSRAISFKLNPHTTFVEPAVPTARYSMCPLLLSLSSCFLYIPLHVGNRLQTLLIAHYVLIDNY